MILFLSMLTRADLPREHAPRAAVRLDVPDPFIGDPACVDYHQGCLKIREKTWRENKRNANFDLMKKQHPNCIVIHNTGELALQDNRSPIKKIQNLYNFSIHPDPHLGRQSTGGKPAWGDIPYHFFIDKFGNLVEGRSPEYAPDTNTVELNTDGKINIVIEGDYNDHFRTDAGQIVTGDRFTKTQAQVTREMVQYLKMKYGITGVSAHRLLAPTDCPGDDIMRSLHDLFTSCPK